MSTTCTQTGVLEGLVNIYSPSGSERTVVSWLVERMQELGYEKSYADGAGNAVGVMGSGPHQIVLLGHIDTVPGEIAVRCENGILYGRGAVDAKGPLAAYVDAVAGLGKRPGWQMIVVGAIDEERDSTGAQYVVNFYKPEYAIIGEPSQWNRVGLGYKGVAWARLQVQRAQTHTASGNESACEAALAGWNRVLKWVEDFNHGRKRAFDRVLPTLRGMRSGDDGLEEWAELRIGVRLPTSLHPEAWYAQLKTLVPSAEITRESYAIPAYQSGKNNRLVHSFLAEIRALGSEPGFVVKTGTADMNIVAPAWGCPTVAYGPGDSGLDHTPNEQLSLEEYAQAVIVLGQVLRRLTSEGAPHISESQSRTPITGD